MKLLFDFGGVLVDLDKARCIDSFDRLGFDIRPYLGTYRQGGPFSLLERGDISVPEFCNELRKLGVRPETEDAAIIRAWEDYLTEVPAERLDMLLKIKRHYSVSCLSNTNEIHWHQAETDFFNYQGHTVADFFDHVFLSCRLRLEKPAPELYARVAQEMGVPPGEILFFDDSEVNCQAARDCGLQALLAPAGSRWFNYFDENGKLLLP
ncbi:HAD family phosphatase [bacterium]|nr:HAD family phosphatase [bacterium]